MAKLKFTVVGKDGSRLPVVAGPKQIIEFEHHFKVGLGKAMSDLHLEHMYWLAWKAVQAEGVSVPLFTDWLDAIEDVEVGGEVAAGPLAPSPTA